MEIKVEKVLTEADFNALFKTHPDDGAPSYVDSNEDEWIDFFYKKGYRMVKLP